MRKFFYFILNFLSPILRLIYRDRLRVLAYHGVPDPVPFEKQLLYLKANYSIIKIEELDAYLNNKEGDSKLPKHPLLITFDDGIYNFKENGFPLLKKYEIPVCMFVVTEAINSNQEFWWDVVAKEMSCNGNSKSEIREYLNSLKKVPNTKRKKVKEQTKPMIGKQLTTADLHDFQNQEIKIGNHSHTHPMFDKCEIDEIVSEMENSKSCFSDWNVDGFKYFAYPNGNYSIKAEKILKDYSIKLAFRFEHKINERLINPLRIARISANSYMGIHELKAKVSGGHSIYSQAIVKLKRMLK